MEEERMASVTIRPRRDTTANWSKYNPILKSGEMGIEIVSGTTLTNIKVGDGNTRWNDLQYSVDFQTIDSAKTAAVSSAASASASQTAASASQSAAAKSENNAASSASAAKSSEDAAAASKTTAATSEANAVSAAEKCQGIVNDAVATLSTAISQMTEAIVYCGDKSEIPAQIMIGNTAYPMTICAMSPTQPATGTEVWIKTEE